MQICKATKQDLPALKQMWVSIFKDSHRFADFAVNICDTEEIYLVKEEDTIVSMVVAGIDLFAGDKKGFYIYGLCTLPQYQGRGFASRLVNYVCDTKTAQGYDFVLLQPVDEEMFGFYRKLGFDGTTYLRTATVEIKRNLWATASFDTVTAGRFKEARDKFTEDEIVHFSKKGYEKFAEYVYSEGGSTAETKDGYCLYYEMEDSVLVRDMFAKSTQHAILLLQAIRERCGKEIARIQISQNSQLFLGEGKLKPHCVHKNLNREVYANLMFD